MGIVSRIRPQARFSEYMENKIREIYGGYSSSSGVSINSETAMRIATVQNCVRVRVATISHLPCHVMKKDGRNKNRAEDFYLYELLHDQPNSWMTSSEFWGMCEAHICLRGNFYAYKAQLPGRRIREIIPLKVGSVQEVKQNADYSLTYRVATNDERVASVAYDDGQITSTSGNVIKDFEQDKIMHVRGMTLNGITGVNPIQYARETLGVGSAGTSFIGKYFSKGMHPGVIFKHPLRLSEPAHKNILESLKKKYAGLGNAWDTMLIDEDMTVEFPTIKLVDAQYLEIMKMNEAQICGLFRVPQMLIASGDKAPTYASAEQFWINFLTIGVTPDAVNYEKTIRRDLLTKEERKTYYAKFETRAVLRSSFKDQMEGFKTAINAEIMNPNEVRDLIDMNPYSGGDTYKTRTSTVREQSNNGNKGGKGNE